MKVLVVNAGSSSHKFSLYDTKSEEPSEPLWTAHVEWGRGQKGRFYTIQTKSTGKASLLLDTPHVERGVRLVLESLWKGPSAVIEGPGAIERVGHRVVHGGSIFQQPVLVDSAVKDRIRQLIPLAPLHNPANLEGIELMEQFFPSAMQIAVFDTAFHASLSEVAKTYPVPYAWKPKGVQRYGFHGISHQYCAQRIEELVKQPAEPFKLINCHLGNGASLCAIREGKSVDTTMGLTPLEGLMMGTRCGSIDPGILFYAMRELQMSPQELDYLLNFESGLKGISGSSDMREILSKTDERAQLALEMYIYRLRSFIGAMAASLEGVDILSFTGGIGENAPLIREKTCEKLAYLGVKLDLEKNDQCRSDQDIAAPSSRVRVFVIHTQEEWMIAKACLSL